MYLHDFNDFFLFHNTVLFHYELIKNCVPSFGFIYYCSLYFHLVATERTADHTRADRSHSSGSERSDSSRCARARSSRAPWLLSLRVSPRHSGLSFFAPANFSLSCARAWCHWSVFLGLVCLIVWPPGAPLKGKTRALSQRIAGAAGCNSWCVVVVGDLLSDEDGASHALGFPPALLSFNK